jgi:hypothetical protein
MERCSQIEERQARSVARGSVCAILVVALLALPASAGAAGWRVQSAPPVPEGSSVVLQGVSCAAADACEAVGSFINAAEVQVPLAESWDGTRWTIDDVPLPVVLTPHDFGMLSSVSCSGRSACTAVGGYGTGPSNATFAERWDGHVWTFERTPQSSVDFLTQLSGVSCWSATACRAVGYGDSTNGMFSFAAFWNGMSWAPQSVPEGPLTPSRDYSNAALASVSCTSPSACTAVGGHDQGALIETWNGHRWAIRRTPKSTDTLAGVSCQSRTKCTAVGWAMGRRGGTKTLVERDNGSRWTIQRSANRRGHGSARLAAVSCARPSQCTAVGFSLSGRRHSRTRPFTEAWDGSRWIVQATPNPHPGSAGALDAISCTAARICTAVGSSGGTALIERHLPAQRR